ncbi:BREX-1 system adenine-specific DNA-methyltransferase PglX [Paenibacillus alvei]|uniref:BREX-1 system adenine-specific DNA-methyltransferase PglX n=1 Tax=Paenibacillus alvei TaxID=44250 RepID=UPI0013DB168C|nr:BREX-1 system adenine-specific DNA-methyltransferase PglX [Paenibacillus alvei]NEZ41027.1 BREX-1 system adenine-specific DNA-methyltransferase PglX [Paenibacillus alvei]
MNKSAIKNFAMWARNKLIADITYKAGLMGITENGVDNPLPQSTIDVQFFDIGTKEPYAITGVQIEQRRNLVDAIQKKEGQSDYKTAYNTTIEEVAYTWFNRLIAVRFMEVNDYLPSRIRVLSSDSSTKNEPDIVTTPFDADLDYSSIEKERIMQMKQDNRLDELFRMLFIKQCNALNAVLPELFERTNDYTELLLNVSFTDNDGIVSHLVNDIPENDFNVEKEGQVEIIGWLYQYYNTEPKDETFALLKKNVKITKERIPAATQLFTPEWIVRYMVENSLGRLWIEGHPNDDLKAAWKYYLDEAEQEPEVQAQLNAIREEYKSIKPEDIKVIDPCMGSGHILVYAFDVLIHIYESYGYSQRDAAKSIIENNLFGLDIDKRAYQLAYFAVMMKARQYNRRILNDEVKCHVYAIQESNGINYVQLKYFGQGMDEAKRKTALSQIEYLLDTMHDAKEYGSILNVDDLDWEILNHFIDNVDISGQVTLDMIELEDTQKQLEQLVKISSAMTQKYDVVVTNPPYMGSNGMGAKLSDYVKKNYPNSKNDLFSVFMERCGQMTKLNCFQAMITQHAWMFLASYEKLRGILRKRDSVNMVHLGARAFEEIGGEVVQTASFVLRNSDISGYRGFYSRLLDYGSQQEKETAYLKKRDLYARRKDGFLKIPGTPIAYWVSERGMSNYEKSKLLKDVAETKQGFKTGNNDKFLRLWFEVPFQLLYLSNLKCELKKWFPCNKGGSYRKWYGNLDYVVNWENDGHDIRNYKDKKGNLLSRPQNLQYNFREALTWSSISSGPISLRYSGPFMMFESKGSGCFVKYSSDLYVLQGFLNSKVGMYYISALAPTLDYSEGSLLKLPYIICENKKIDSLVKKCIDISIRDWNSFETSWDFTRHPFIDVCSNEHYRIVVDDFYQDAKDCNIDITNTKYSVELAYMNWSVFTEAKFSELRQNEEELNRIFIDIYGLQDELTPEVDEKDITIRKANLDRDIRSFLSYAVGCMFGRYSLDVDGLAYAGGDWDESKYSTFIPDKDNIILITDEEYFDDDIVGLFCAFLKETFGESTLEENLEFIAKALGNKGSSSREVIRNYFMKDFFKNHCKIYQKRPIYWLFDSGKTNGFKALVYMHRYNVDTIGDLRIDYLHRMQRVYDSEIERMQETIDNSNNAREITAATKRKEKLTKQLKETKEYDEKIAHLALARISIDLDDGVKVNYDKVQTGTDGKKLDVLAKI